MINDLKNRGVNVYATSTNDSHKEDFFKMGAKDFIPYSNFIDKTVDIKFNAVIDPFFDISLKNVLPFFDFFGRYITCGVYNQHPLYENIDSEADFKKIMSDCIFKNMSLIGNCLGSREDLENAIIDYNAGKFDVIIDSVFSGNDIIPFLEKTFSIVPRFGKVVYKYDD